MPLRKKFLVGCPISVQREAFPPWEPKAADDLAYTVERLGRDMTWAGFCQAFALNAREAAGGRFRTAERMFRSVCKPDRLADVTPEMLSAFVDALRARGMTPAEINARVAALNIGIDWGIAKGVIDAKQFNNRVAA